eukprot:1628579-Amphidinium_carterae.1
MTTFCLPSVCKCSARGSLVGCNLAGHEPLPTQSGSHPVPRQNGVMGGGSRLVCFSGFCGAWGGSKMWSRALPGILPCSSWMINCCSFCSFMAMDVSRPFSCSGMFFRRSPAPLKGLAAHPITRHLAEGLCCGCGC